MQLLAPVLAGLLLAGCAAAQLDSAPSAVPSSPVSPTPSLEVASEQAAGESAQEQPASREEVREEQAPLPTPTAAPTSPASQGWATHVSSRFAVCLRYPPNWVPNRGYPERYEGPDGFFQLEAATSPTLDYLARSQAYHKLRPFGSQPTITPMVVDGQEARLIWPSEDEPKVMKGLAELDIQPSGPLQGSEGPWPYLMLGADKEHIRAIADTLRFDPKACDP